jgi:hypothetical protein
VCLTTKEAGMFEDSEEAGHADNQQLDLNFIGGRMCISPFLTSEFWGRDHNESGPEVSKMLIALFNRSLICVIDIVAPYSVINHNTASSDELSKVVAPSLPAAECIH